MTRQATIRTAVDHPAETASALRPDNTAEMRTWIEDGAVVAEIERDSTGGLRSSLDDYVVNLSVAVEVAQLANRHTNTDT